MKVVKINGQNVSSFKDIASVIDALPAEITLDKDPTRFKCDVSHVWVESGNTLKTLSSPSSPINDAKHQEAQAMVIDHSTSVTLGSIRPDPLMRVTLGGTYKGQVVAFPCYPSKS